MRVCAVVPLHACPRYYPLYCIVLPADNVRYLNVLASCTDSMRCPHTSKGIHLERYVDHHTCSDSA
ncbi:hypothetical protein E4T47_02085 [Aureobasidium subglaciale]|nr:hypothetical protein E4T47_02085 [Aureobasidium subglaciale]